jgi:hypothetical protein
MKNKVLCKAILSTLGAALAGVSTSASAISPANLGSIAAGANSVVTGSAPNRAWSDYGTNSNYGWTHTASFRIFQVGTNADLAAGTRFDVTIDLQQNGGANPMNYPGFSIWTSGTTPLAAGATNGSGYGHAWSQVRGPFDGGSADNPCSIGGDCSLGSNGWLGAGGGGNLVSGHDGWIGYANAGYSFKNGDNDLIQGLYAGATNPSNLGQYGDGGTGSVGGPAEGTALTNINASSPYVNGGSATLSSGDAMLSLFGLKAGYYLIGWAGSCPDDNANGQNCAVGGGRSYKLTISNSGVTAVPVPAAAWLFGSALAGMGIIGRRREGATA